jgi:hypothetical protein|tara:strand:- start:24537 stop:24809 length:273 start_codon:yes stop_codon:yes gene_type:complete
MKVEKIVALLVFYVGGICVCAGLGISFGVRGDPRWYTVVPPIILALCLSVINGPEFAIKPSSYAALMIGGLSLFGAILGYLYGPAMLGMA